MSISDRQPVAHQPAHRNRMSCTSGPPGVSDYLGGPAFGLPELARIITEVTGTKVTYRNLSAGEYASWLQRTGLDEATAHFVAALDASIARGDLETGSQDLARLLGRPARPLTEVVRAAHDAFGVRKA